MCGITGIIKRRHYPINDIQIIKRMLGKTIHRGPDDMGVCGLSMNNFLQSVLDVNDIHNDVWALLGFNRLSIQDISHAGHQPMLSNDNNVVLSFNGEIYNVNELRKELLQRGAYQFRGNSDTEVILYLYQEYGILEMAKKLNGMFAIVIYDKIKNTFYFVRDRFGIIPLHYYINADKILYGSEIKAIIECVDFERELNKTALFASLTYGYSDMPIHKNIQNAEPGVILTWDANRDEFHETRFFDINDYYQHSFYAKHDYLAEATAVFKSCVNRQLISDVSLGVQLSGGVDSTLVTHCVSDAFKKKDSALYGFSLTNHDAPKYDEEKYIDYAASLNDIQVSKIDLCLERFIDGLEPQSFGFNFS